MQMVIQYSEIYLQLARTGEAAILAEIFFIHSGAREILTVV